MQSGELRQALEKTLEQAIDDGKRAFAPLVKAINDTTAKFQKDFQTVSDIFYASFSPKKNIRQCKSSKWFRRRNKWLFKNQAPAK